MTREEIQAEADKRYPPLRNHITTEEDVQDALNDGFVAGAEWMQSKAEDMIKEAIEKVKPKWFSVKDRWHKPAGFCLIVQHTGVWYGYYRKDIRFCTLSVARGLIKTKDVTHWMPLPEPPKPK